MNCVVGECERELRINEAQPLDDPNAYTELNASLLHYVAIARQCKIEYFAIVRKAEQDLADRWIASEDEDLRKIGEALKDRDYSGLAI